MAEDMSSQLDRSSNMFSQLEGMMAAVRHESASLENLKSQMKSMEEEKKEIPVLKEKLQFAEESIMVKNRDKQKADEVNQGLQADLQRLNDMYVNERRQNLESQEKQLSLDQEVARCKLELDNAVKSAPRIADLQKLSQSQKLQIDILTQKLEEEQRAVQKGVKLLEKQVEEAEQCKATLSQHFWSVSEELKQSQEQLDKERSTSGQLEQALVAMGQRVEESGMELQQAASSRQAGQQEAETKYASALRDLEETNKRLSDGKANLVMQLSEHQAQLAECEQRIRTLEDAHKSLGTAKEEAVLQYEREHAEHERSRQEIGSLTARVETAMSRELELKTEIEEWEKKYADLNISFKSESTAKSDALLSISNSSTVHEALENQLKEANQKNWENIQNSKEVELEFESKLAAQQQLNSDKDTRIQSLEEEREQIQQMYQEEVGRISNMSGVLKAELEKRLTELSVRNQEREAARAESGRLQEQLDRAEESLKKKEKIFAHVVETDRKQISNELKGKNSRLRALENEKQDLLKETQHLMEQISMEQKLKTESIKEFKKSKALKEEAEEDCRTANTEAKKYKREAERLVQVETQLKAQLLSSEEQFREDITRLDGIVKNSKRTAAKQVADLSNKVKALEDEIKEERAHKEGLVESEKTATSSTEKITSQLEAVKLELEEFQFSAAKEIATAKREAQHTSGKVKSLLDIKSKMEMELVQLRLERARSGGDATRLADRVRELEGMVEDQGAAIKRVEDENEKLTASNRRLKSNEIDAEAALGRNTKHLTKAKEEIDRLEKHSMIEGKKMRTQLNAMNRKIHESDDTIANLQEEMETCTAAYTKLQNTSNKTITGLIEELKRTEELLSQERVASNHEVSSMQHHLTEMRSKLENTTQTMQEKLYHQQSDSTDKENLLNQLNTEASRLKALCHTKEQRIVELEKHHQDDRSKLQELRNEVVAAENAVADIQLELAKSETKRSTLEERMEQMEDRHEEWKQGRGEVSRAVQGSYAYSPGSGGAAQSFDGGGGTASIDEYSNDYYGGSIASSYDIDPKYKLFIDHEEGEANEVAEDEGLHAYSISEKADRDRDRAGRPSSHKEANKYSPSGYKRDKPQHSAPAVSHFRHSPIVDKYDEFALQQDIEEEEGIKAAIAAANSYQSSYGNKAAEEVEDDLDTRRVHDSIDLTQKYLNRKNNADPGGGGEDETAAASIARTQQFLKRRGMRGKDVGAATDGGAGVQGQYKQQEKSKRSWGSLAHQEGGDKSSPNRAQKEDLLEKTQQGQSTGDRAQSGGNFSSGSHEDDDDKDGLMFNINAPSLVPATPPSSQVTNATDLHDASREKASIERMRKKKKKKKEPSLLNFDTIPVEGARGLQSARSSARSSARGSSRGHEEDEEEYDEQQRHQQGQQAPAELLLPRISPRLKGGSREGKRATQRK